MTTANTQKVGDHMMRWHWVDISVCLAGACVDRNGSEAFAIEKKQPGKNND